MVSSSKTHVPSHDSVQPQLKRNGHRDDGEDGPFTNG